MAPSAQGEQGSGQALSTGSPLELSHQETPALLGGLTISSDPALEGPSRASPVMAPAPHGQQVALRDLPPYV